MIARTPSECSPLLHNTFSLKLFIFFYARERQLFLAVATVDLITSNVLVFVNVVCYRSNTSLHDQ